MAGQDVKKEVKGRSHHEKGEKNGEGRSYCARTERMSENN